MHIPINKARRTVHRFSVSAEALCPLDSASMDSGIVTRRLTLSGRNRLIRFGTFVRFLLLTLAASMILTGRLAQADQPGTNPPHVIEVFTTTDRPVSPSSIDRISGQGINIELQVYRIDGIQQLEGALSHHLPADPVVAKRVAFGRIQQLDNQSTTRMRNAAIGLTKALQYGIDRYPAMVFNGQCVVYGVTELGQALRQYHQWQGGS